MDGQKVDPTSDLFMKQDGRYGDKVICPTITGTIMLINQPHRVLQPSAPIASVFLPLLGSMFPTLASLLLVSVLLLAAVSSE